MSRAIAAAALVCARRGVPVVPVQRSKRPYFPGWLDAASCDDAQVQAWWHRYPDANVAAPTGRRSGFLVLDVDPRNGGDDALASLAAQHGALPATLTSATGGGGRHYYFRLPEFPVRSCQIADGVEILGERKAVTLPPSIHASGRCYAWEDGTRERAAAPAWLLDRLRPRTAPAVRAPRPAISDAYVRAAVAAECDAVTFAAPGSRNRTLNRAAFCLGTLVGAGALPPEAAVHLLLEAAEACGLPQREAVATVRSGLRAGVAQPRVIETSARPR